MAKLQVAGPPPMNFFDKAGRKREGTRLVGDVTSASIVRSAALVAAGPGKQK
ncbi:hypothetical protein [Brucella sp. 10RB9215]|uniref:hypothetical protein n=1 Tax=Brucella sp. 10RB9215 TaxID=1149953 RepID=UPI00155A86E8|nr:hypothetical protein [Brucella sp. 10RB9215]